MKVLALQCLVLCLTTGLCLAGGASGAEIREYEGKPLDPYQRDYDNSIRGPQDVDLDAYRLVIDGRVENPLALSLPEVLDLPSHRRAITLHCVEGWEERLLFEGVRLVELIRLARPRQGVTTVIFHAHDGYSSSLPLAFVEERDILLAHSINGLRLDRTRGMPFQVVAESKFGYKWVKWVTRIELSDKPYLGYWEQRGYSNEADLPR